MQLILKKILEYKYENFIKWLFIFILFIAGVGEISFRKIGIPFEFGDKVENMVAFVLVLWIPFLIRKKDFIFRKRSIDWFIYGYLLINFVTAVYYQAGFGQFIKILTGVFVYYMVLKLYDSTLWKKRLFIAIITAGIITFSIGIYKFLQGIYFSADKRILTLYEHPNITAFVVNAIIFTSIVLFIRSTEKLTKIVTGLCVITGIICLILTLSRTGWIAFLVSLIVLTVFVKKIKYVVLIFCILILLISISCLMFNTIIERSSTLLEPLKEKSVINRIVYWKASIAMVKAHPFLGIGIGQRRFMQEFPQYRVEDTEEYPIHSHNTYLNIAATSGILSFGLFLFILLISFRYPVYCIRKNKLESYEYSIGMIVLTVLLSFIIGFFIEYPFYFTKIVILFWIYLALGRSIAEQKTK